MLDPSRSIKAVSINRLLSRYFRAGTLANRSFSVIHGTLNERCIDSLDFNVGVLMLASFLLPRKVIVWVNTSELHTRCMAKNSRSL